MIDDDLAPDLRSLFDAEKRRDDVPPPGAQDRVSHALSISLGIGIGAAAGSASASTMTAAAASQGAVASVAAATGTTTTTAASAAATTALATATTTAASAGVTATGGALAKGLAFALVTAMAGTTGTGIYLAARDDVTPAVREVVAATEVPSTFDPTRLAKKQPPARPVVTRPRAAPEPPADLAPVALVPLVAATPVELERSAVALSNTPVTVEQKAERLRGERAVLDSARSAVSRGDGGAALIALEAHRASYAEGALVEEREALTVLALAKLGRGDDAKKKAAAFRVTYARSLFLPAIDGALR